MNSKKVTFADIAKYTNFSKTTISRYFNNPDSLTIENQEKIARALEVLGYQENKLAKVLANGKSEFIGIIVPNLYLHYYAEMLNQILSTYRQHNYKFLVFVGDKEKETEQNYINELLAYKIEGLIVLSHTLTSEELAGTIEELAVRGTSHIVFVIGGSIGLSEAVLGRSDYALSFSKMTFPHQLMRMILLEQVYRSYRIIHGEPYHK